MSLFFNKICRSLALLSLATALLQSSLASIWAADSTKISPDDNSYVGTLAIIKGFQTLAQKIRLEKEFANLGYEILDSTYAEEGRKSYFEAASHYLTVRRIFERAGLLKILEPGNWGALDSNPAYIVDDDLQIPGIERATEAAFAEIFESLTQEMRGKIKDAGLSNLLHGRGIYYSGTANRFVRAGNASPFGEQNAENPTILIVAQTEKNADSIRRALEVSQAGAVSAHGPRWRYGLFEITFHAYSDIAEVIKNV